MLWYSLGAPWRDTSNEYHNVFLWKDKKTLCGYTLLSGAVIIPVNLKAIIKVADPFILACS